MDTKVQPDLPRAIDQWESLVSILKNDLGFKISLVSAKEGLPDMVFTANAGYVHGNQFIPSRFKYPQRSGEEPLFIQWFKKRGYDIRELSDQNYFEGAGDALPLGNTIFAGYHFRSEIGSHTELGNLLGARVISLELVLDRFYHLDTCFCPLGNGDLIYYPGAFDKYGQKAIENSVGAGKIIRVEEEESATFSCNAVAADDAVIMNEGAPKLVKELKVRGLRVFQTDLSEFIKSGGSAKCLTLRLN
ncbi:MAG: dimethylarginine dimethylaminohydrolase family protein [Candidatus Scalindua sp.]